MSYVINAFTPSTITYVAQGTLDNLSPCAKINIDVANAAIFWSIRQQLSAYGGAGAGFGAEVMMLPGSRTIVRRNMTGVQVRASMAGPPWPVITVEAIPNDESG